MPTITYKQLQDSWIRSDWVDSNTDDFGEDEPVILPEFVSFGTVTVQDLMERIINKVIAMQIEKCTHSFQQALQEAQSLAVHSDHTQIEPVHLLIALLQQENSNVSYLM